MLLALCLLTILHACNGGYDGGRQITVPAPETRVAPDIEKFTPANVAPAPLADGIAMRKMELLDRGLVVIPAHLGNAVSWRLLGTDKLDIVFDVYRNDVKLNTRPIANTTFYLDEEGQATDTYTVKTYESGEEVASDHATPWAAAYKKIPLSKPLNVVIEGVEQRYHANDATVADLDGDGRYEIILKWDANGKDNTHEGITANVLIDAYTLEGKQLWRVDLGPNIRAGAHYNPFIVYDFDGDGRAELAVRTADGTIDGDGTVIGDATADYRDANGRVLEGPEFLTMFDGLSGRALDTIDYLPARGSVDAWGDSYGNRVDRFLAGMAWFESENPSLIMARGYYTRAVIATYDWVDGAFESRWVLDTDNGGEEAALIGQGAHSLSVGDADGDGKDEIVYGAATIDDNGKLLYSTNLGHGDALHFGDLDPTRPGLEIFMVHECGSCYREINPVTEEVIYDHGVEMHDAATGTLLWSKPGGGDDVGRGVSIDIDPRSPGNESWGSRGGYTAAVGAQLSSDRPSSMNFALYWDGDLLRELLNGTTISKWNYNNFEPRVVLDASLDGGLSNNGTKSTPSLSADILGDWREEVIWRSTDSTHLLLYSSPINTHTRIHTLMHDAHYRAAIAWQNVGYNQPPHTGFFLGYGMEPRGQAPIYYPEEQEWAQLVTKGTASNNIELRFYIRGFTASEIEIFRDTDADPEGRQRIATVSGDSKTFLDENVQRDETYFYWAELKDSSSNSISNFNMSSTSLSTLYTLEAISSGGPAVLKWSTARIDIAGISIYQAEALDPAAPPDFDNRTLIANPEVDATRFTVTNGQVGVPYYYWVDFLDLAGEVYSTQAVRAGNGITPPNVLRIELESLSNQALFAPFVVVEDATASGGQYVEWPENGTNPVLNPASEARGGVIAIPFSLSEASDVQFDINANMPNVTDDSFHYRIDAGTWRNQNNTLTNGWETLHPATFNNLGAGIHTLYIQRREAGAKLDAVTLTTSTGIISP